MYRRHSIRFRPTRSPRRRKRRAVRNDADPMRSRARAGAHRGLMLRVNPHAVNRVTPAAGWHALVLGRCHCPFLVRTPRWRGRPGRARGERRRVAARRRRARCVEWLCSAAALKRRADGRGGGRHGRASRNRTGDNYPYSRMAFRFSTNISLYAISSSANEFRCDSQFFFASTRIFETEAISSLVPICFMLSISCW